MSVRQKIFFPIICLILVELASLSPVPGNEEIVLTQSEKIIGKNVNMLYNEVQVLGELVTDFSNYINDENFDVDDDSDEESDYSSEESEEFDPALNYDEHLTCVKNCDDPDIPNSCAQAVEEWEDDGAYLLDPLPDIIKPFYGYCIYEGESTEKSWLVIQRRKDGSENFFRNWHDYKFGFGNINNEFWIGLERIHQITRDADFELLIEIHTFLGESLNVTFTKFALASEDENYAITVGGAMSNSPRLVGDLELHNNEKFSTFDKDNDDDFRNCAQEETAAWWYGYCSRVNLNGIYHTLSNKHAYYGIRWGVNSTESLQYVQMSIRPFT